MQAVISDEIIIDLKQNVKLLFLAGKDSSLFELVEPIDDISPVKNILSKVGVSAYHFCYEVPNLEESIHVLALLTIYRF
jgi:methylmalonyl-CoA/ethylmalonyl-CoA epimerase